MLVVKHFLININIDKTTKSPKMTSFRVLIDPGHVPGPLLAY